MLENLNPHWKEFLSEEFEKEYFSSLKIFVETQYQQKNCFPEKDHIFSAFNLCPLQNLKMVLLGQDPYHGQGQANGLAFSVNEGIALPPSLINIFKEMEDDLGEKPRSGDLTSWAEQGVLLLNSVLSVEENKPTSHNHQGWETFTDSVIYRISERCENVVFLLWGGYAKKKVKLINPQKHLILLSGHPSPLSANRGYWFGNRHFSKTNDYLISKGKSPIQF